MQVSLVSDLGVAVFFLKEGDCFELVHDAFRRKGIGRKLMEMVIKIGRWKGLQEICGEVVAADNEKMLKLCRKLGFVTKWLPLR